MVPMLCLIPPHSTPIEGTPCLLSLLDHNVTLARTSLRWRRGVSKDLYSWPRDGLRALWFNYGKELMLVISCWVVKFHGEGNDNPLQYSCLKIAWTEEPGRLQSMGSLRVGHDWVTSLSLSLSCIGEGNGNPLQCSCLENPRDGGAWRAAISGVAQSQTRLKWLSSSSK